MNAREIDAALWKNFGFGAPKETRRLYRLALMRRAYERRRVGGVG